MSEQLPLPLPVFERDPGSIPGSVSAEAASGGEGGIGSIAVTPNMLVTALDIQAQLARERALQEQALRQKEAGEQADKIAAAYMSGIANDPEQQRELGSFINPHYAVKMQRARKNRIAEIDAQNASRQERGLPLEQFPDHLLRELGAMIKERGIDDSVQDDKRVLRATNAALVEAGLKKIEKIPEDIAGRGTVTRAVNALLRERGLPEVEEIPKAEHEHARFGQATPEDRVRWGQAADRRAHKSRFGRAALVGVPMAPGMGGPLEQTKRRDIRKATRAARKSGKKLSIDTDIMRYEGDPKSGYQHGGVAIDPETGKSKWRSEDGKLRGMSREEKKFIRFGEKRYRELSRKSRDAEIYLKNQGAHFFTRHNVKQHLQESRPLAPARIVAKGAGQTGKFLGKQVGKSARGYREFPAAYRQGHNGTNENGGRLQKQLNRLARAAGKTYGKVKARRSTPKTDE